MNLTCDHNKSFRNPFASQHLDTVIYQHSISCRDLGDPTLNKSVFHEMEKNCYRLEGKYFSGGAGWPGAKIQMGATQHTLKYLKVIGQTNSLLRETCSALCTATCRPERQLEWTLGQLGDL